MSERTAKDYISSINKNIKDVLYPDELEELILKTKGNEFAKGLRDFFNYLEESGLTNINGYDLDRWRKKTLIKRYQANEIYISDEELKEAYYSHIRKIGDSELELCFMLLVFSGLRLKHILEAMQQFDPQNVIKLGKI